MRKSNVKDLEAAGLLSAIWILANRSESPFITYRTVRNRFGLSDNYDVRFLIDTRRELFRQGIPEDFLIEWKEMLLERLQSGEFPKLPGWVFESEDFSEQKEAILAIERGDVFKSQFRIFKAGPTPNEVVNWGLNYLDQLRQAEGEEKESWWKWFKEGFIPTLSLVIALGTVLITSYFQYQSIQSQRQLKEYEVSFKPKQEGYALFMKSIIVAFQTATEGSREIKIEQKLELSEELNNHLDEAEKAYFSVEAFIEPNKRQDIYSKLKEYRAYLMEVNSENTLLLSVEQRNERVRTEVGYEAFFRSHLMSNLFPEPH